MGASDTNPNLQLTCQSVGQQNQIIYLFPERWLNLRTGGPERKLPDPLCRPESSKSLCEREKDEPPLRGLCLS